MKRLFLCLAVATVALVGQAQPRSGTFSLIPRVGVSLSKLNSSEILRNIDGGGGEVLKSRYKPGFVVGADAQYQIGDRGAVSLGVFYTRQGERFDDMADKTVKEDRSVIFSGAHNIHLNLDYINVPLMAHLYLADGLSFNSGVQVGFLVGAKSYQELTGYTETPNVQTGEVTRVYDKLPNGTELNGYEQKDNVKSAYKKVALSIPIGISYEYMNVVLEARYNVGLTKANEFGSKDRTFLFTVGYKFDL
ncbi:PorT family protein [Prevotella buccae]|uniref:porin family protein n=1 Tax=Segatella buccae TaxID=28126 RepID=UPI001C5E973C|nr:porin family protein [Segatella buccae]MBW4871174.1 PorT family protein [Segatella buccae]